MPCQVHYRRAAQGSYSLLSMSVRWLQSHCALVRHFHVHQVPRHCFGAPLTCLQIKQLLALCTIWLDQRLSQHKLSRTPSVLPGIRRVVQLISKHFRSGTLIATTTARRHETAPQTPAVTKTSEAVDEKM